MKFGLRTFMLHPRMWLPVAQEADRLGFESIWLPEHLVLPVAGAGSPLHGEEHPPIAPEIPVYDALVFLAAIASTTTNLRLATHVYNLGLRHPFVTARAIATLDVISGGRVEFGIGASWNRQEWEVTQLDFDSRGRRVNEALEVCQRLWSESVVEHHGEFFDFAPVMFEPKPPQQPWPKIHMGGDGPPALRRAARMCDGWVPANHTIEEVPEARKRIEAMRADAGRTGDFEVTFDLVVDGPDDLARCEEAGVDRVLLRPWQGSRDALDGIKRFADQYM
jgi:probable F420-dependent oxidoreductase